MDIETTAVRTTTWLMPLTPAQKRERRAVIKNSLKPGRSDSKVTETPATLVLREQSTQTESPALWAGAHVQVLPAFIYLCDLTATPTLQFTCREWRQGGWALMVAEGEHKGKTFAPRVPEAALTETKRP